MTRAAVVTHGLTKEYGPGKGLFDLDLEVPAGSVFGFLGPNGSGKSTTIRLLMGLISATRGSATVLGLDSWRDAVQLKRDIGYVPGELADFGGLRGSEVVEYVSGLRGGIDRERVEGIRARIDLDLGQRYRDYSRGTKQKLAILLALMHRPRLLILDEPTGGLDPLNQQAFHRLVAEARDDGATVFLSSHVLSEVEQTCDRVGIVREGRLVTVAQLDELHALRVHRVEVQYRGASPAARLQPLETVTELEDASGRLRFAVRGPFSAVLHALDGTEVVTLTSQEPSLEEMFLSYYGDEAEAPPPDRVAAG